MLLVLHQNMLLGDVTLVEVPDVVGETQSAGTTTLETALFVVAVEAAYSSTVPVGTIISQSPAAGIEAPEGSTVTITVSLGEANTGAGKSKRRRRYFVSIDGQDFEVRSPEEAQELLQKAVALSEKAAEAAVESAPAKRKAKVAPVAVSIPEIRTNAPVDLAPYREQIERAYRNAAAARELRLLLEAQDRDDDEAAYLLLH